MRWVSPAGATAGARDGVPPVFRALAEIADAAIVVGGRADVVVGRRSLISHAFEPLRQLKESLADAPATPGSPLPPQAEPSRSSLPPGELSSPPPKGKPHNPPPLGGAPANPSPPAGEGTGEGARGPGATR